MDDRYLETARLLAVIAPIVLDTDAFALKGGTAINLFVRDMPRLSVDLDLVVRDGSIDRETALSLIDRELGRTRTELERLGMRVDGRSTAGTDDTLLQVTSDRTQVKVEVNHVMRGTIRPIEQTRLAPSARDVLRADVTIPVLAVDELYGSKLVAAMDRQHPRDLFDVEQLLKAEGLTPPVVESFVAYLACHPRPIHEVLFARTKNIALEYAEQFSGMTVTDVSLEQLHAVRERLFAELPRRMTKGQRQFLISLARAEPDFGALGVPVLGSLPAMRWKLQNLGKLRGQNPAKLAEQADALEGKLGALT